ncbi:MAG: hypothetical protein U9N18_07165 [Campylobacterota bacterium]|nr:hypothetical protein [Campylobacterota bacterium]
MVSKWSSNAKTKNRVKDLLDQAGIPLEIKVAIACREFCQSRDAMGQVHIITERIVYSPSPSEEIYREIDQHVQIYEEFEVDELTGIQLIVNLPIECKHRADIEVFGFPSISFSNIHRGFPIHGDSFAGSTYFRSLRESYLYLSKLYAFNIVLVEIKDGTPKKIYKEDLIYKAAGSLYDWVLFDISGSDIEEAQHNPIVDELFKDFQDYLQKHHYTWWFVLREWINKKIDIEKCMKFNERYFGGHRIYHDVTAHLPIVCVNGPLYSVKIDSNLTIEDFEERLFLTTLIRKQGWPGSAEIGLLSRTPEVPVVVTNPEGLKTVLEIGFGWYQDIRKRLETAPPEVLKRWVLESTFFERVCSYYNRQEGVNYRSDLDYRRWL